MKCPSCSLAVNDNAEQCPQCHFHFASLGEKIKNLPRKQGWVIDAADIIDEEHTNLLYERLINFHKNTGAVMYVLTTPSSEGLQPAEYAFYFLNHYRIGGSRHRGILLLLSLQEKMLVCEVGYSLETILTDEEAMRILQTDGLPLLKTNEFGEALFSVTCLITDLIQYGRGLSGRLKKMYHLLFKGV